MQALKKKKEMEKNKKTDLELTAAVESNLLTASDDNCDTTSSSEMLSHNSSSSCPSSSSSSSSSHSDEPPHQLRRTEALAVAAPVAHLQRSDEEDLDSRERAFVISYGKKCTENGGNVDTTGLYNAYRSEFPQWNRNSVKLKNCWENHKKEEKKKLRRVKKG